MGYQELARDRQKEDALWATRFDQLRQHLGDEALLSLTTFQRKSEWLCFDRVNRLKEQRKKGLARLDNEQLPSEKLRTNDSSSNPSIPDSNSDSFSDEDSRWRPYYSRSLSPVRNSAIEEKSTKPVPRSTIEEEAPKPKVTKNRKPYEPKYFPSDLKESYNKCHNPGLPDDVKKSNISKANCVLQAMHRQIFDSMEPQRRENYLRRLKTVRAGDFKKVREEIAASECEDSESESDDEATAVAASKMKKRRKPAAQTVRAAALAAPAQKTQSRKHKATGDDQDEEDPAAASEASQKKPAAKKSRVARGKAASRAKLNPNQYLSPSSSPSGSSRSVSSTEQQEQKKLREIDPNRLLDGIGTSSASAALATVAEEETPAKPAPAPKKKPGRPRKVPVP